MLTDTKIKNLKPTDKLYKISDRDGLYVAVTKSGTVSFRYDYRINGRRETITLGRYGGDGITLAEARKRLVEAKKMISDGFSPSAQKRTDKKLSDKSNTFSAYAELYFENAKFADSTRKMKMSVLEREIVTVLGRYLMTEINTVMVRDLCEKIKLRGARATALQTREIIQSVYNFAISRGEAFQNPVANIRASSIATFEERTRTLTQKEIGIFLNALDEIGAMQSVKAAVCLVFLTLVRKSELIKAKWEEVDFSGGVWTIPEGRMKARRPHNVYLSQQALDLFIALKIFSGASEFILPLRYELRRHMSQSTLNNVIGTTIAHLNKKGFEFEHFTVHDIRRTGSTLLHELGFNTDWIEKCLAHEQNGVRAVYNKAEYAAQRADMLQQWANMLDSWKKENRL
ncbi:tyrosine-type recombinase/integrase [Xenorhabdus bovienii]|uniref:tyrosine-type recombinase/integrase n=1 Tax=Xenorhabdus bovienii TaxID=40576 RepID=UPI0023B2874C|nr:site-specific integrase [Xenorhabdus bovienii]MDE9542861.1 tyrosine-type recombinase/integrase [Xenorhabdus bovienii]MDE9564955.1 tyrosine-type recombinase/integrase [Xenorhabdus bovienii]